MKKSQKGELRQKPKEELFALIGKRQKDILNGEAERSMGKAKNVKQVRNLKKELAFLKTILREREVVSSFAKATEDRK